MLCTGHSQNHSHLCIFTFHGVLRYLGGRLHGAALLYLSDSRTGVAWLVHWLLLLLVRIINTPNMAATQLDENEEDAIPDHQVACATLAGLVDEHRVNAYEDAHDC